jgi:hypothetical protein
MLSSDIAYYNKAKPTDTLQIWSLEADFLLIKIGPLLSFSLNVCLGEANSCLYVMIYDSMNDCMNVCFLVYISISIPVFKYRNCAGSKMHPAKPKNSV